MKDPEETKRPSDMEVDQSQNKRPRTVNDGLRHKTWYAVVMKEGSPNNGLETGLHWSAQPGCEKGAFVFHKTTSEAQEYYDNIEVEHHWHGDETNACPLVMLEMKLLCSCQKRLVGSGVMKPEKNTSGKVRMKWRDVLRESIKDDGWGATMGKEIFHARVLKEVNGCDGGMPDAGMPGGCGWNPTRCDSTTESCTASSRRSIEGNLTSPLAFIGVCSQEDGVPSLYTRDCRIARGSTRTTSPRQSDRIVSRSCAS